MCGIAGIARFHPADDRRLLAAMTDALVHRGPDDEGAAVFPDSGVAIGMRRLSILDIEGGHQPMQDESGRYSLVFNGEIYNYADLWTELVELGHRFQSDHSDTEVIVHGFEEWGTGVFERLNGMFAIAIWDDVEHRLTLARDRAGEKPLYLGRLSGGGYVFGSELKALLLHPELERTVDMTALEQYLAFDFIVGPRSILESVEKIPGGHWATIDAGGCEVHAYWRPTFSTVRRTTEEILEELDALLDRSVRLRMVADVPVGLFLSGGLDSSTIGWYMARHSDEVRSFTIGFDDPRFDESVEAQQSAAHLGIENLMRVFSEQDVLDLIPKVTDLLDEPMGDQSIFPTYLLSTVARKHVKVALGGDGSDELFMGYRTFQALKVAWVIDASPLGPIARALGRRMPTGGPDIVGKVGRLSRSLSNAPEDRLLMRLGSFGGDSYHVLARDRTAGQSALEAARATLAPAANGDAGAPERTSDAYLRGYLQEDILVKVDRASMARSLEVRSPFLDPAVIDFALSLPAESKLRGLRNRKDPVRRLMRGRLPDPVIVRPKRGFGVPLSAWLRSSARPLLDDYLSPSRLGAAGYFDPAVVADIRKRHDRGSVVAGDQLWLLLQFELWRDRWLSAPHTNAAT